MKKSVLAASAAFAALAFAGAAQAQDAPFSGVAVFGDSLSDVGNIATQNGLAELNSFTTNPGQVAVEVVAGNYGFTLAPSLQGGTNSAYGSAGYVNNAFGAPAAIPTLTAQVDSYLAAHASVDPNALYVLFGGGNDVNFAATNMVLGIQTLAEAQAATGAAGIQAVAVLTALQNAGAETMIVVNAPDVGLTPSAKGADAISAGSSGRITTLAQAFNASLNAGLDGKTGVVPVNAFLLLQETVANKDAFGLIDVTNTACTTSSSLTCTTSTLKAPDADQTWLFADGIHPTTAGHKALGDLILSELAAPQQVSLLAEQPLGLVAVTRNAIGAELADAEAGARLFGALSLESQDFDAQYDIAASDDFGGVVTLGGLWPLSDRLLVGAALSLAQTETDYGAKGGFETSGVLVDVFGRVQVGESGYISGQATLGRLAFDDVERRITLGQNQRSEQGETDGDVRAFMLAGGYWFGGGGMRHGPVASIGYTDVRVEGYSEESASSTAMRFLDQNRESLITELGWAVRGTWEPNGMALSPYAEVTYNFESKDDGREVSAGLVTMPGTFSMAAFTPNDEWIAVKLGTGIDLGGKAALTASYAGRFGDWQDDHMVSLGVNMRY